MMNILNLNKKIEEKKLKEFKEKATQAAKEIDEIFLKYEVKIIPFIQMSSWGNSPLIQGLTAQYTFQPLTLTEIETLKLRAKKDEAMDTKLDTEKTS